LGIAGGVGAYLTYRAFRRQKNESVTRLRENSRIIATVCGPIEYAMKGDGATVLICHGGGGGYDQGLLLSWPEDGFQFLAPSRPGYLRTPLETGETFEAQADAYAAMLDALDIHHVAVLAASGGGPSALQFALRHPDRCWGIIMLSAISQSIPAFPFIMQQITDRVIPHFDFIPWLIFNTPVLDVLIDRNTRAQIGDDVHKRTHLRELMRTLFPASLRVEGMLNDVKQIAKMPTYPLERITAPALVIHGDRDSIVPFAQGQWSADTIPSARFLPIENGEHFSFITHKEIVGPTVIAFLKSHAPQSQLTPR
jgi:pimeloyl-ACP methyl ester carboxylesterase